jgi:hypothetical protein
VTPRGAVALGCQLSGDRELALKRRAGLGQLLDVAFDTVEPLLLGHVSLNRHAGQYHRLSPRCHFSPAAAAPPPVVSEHPSIVG